MPKVSVVVPTFERAERLPALIAALEAQSLPRDDFDVIIVDDASRDGTAGVLEHLVATAGVKLRVLRNERNRGPGVARNAGWRASDAPVIAFTDDDCTPAPQWLEAGLAALDGAPIGIVQGKTIPDPNVALGRWAVTQTIESFTDRYETCNIFYRADVLRVVGGFDENMPFFGEDTVLGWTARRMGIDSVFEGRAVVHHAVSHPGVDYFRRWAVQHGNWAILVRRFPEMRREVLWLRLFTKRRHAALIAAAGGIAGGVFWRPALALAIPYAMYLFPRKLQRDEVVDRLLGAVFDSAVVAGMLRGSARERTLVL
jgi:glycosyltransferase involved in cell wall biosynthesis